MSTLKRSAAAWLALIGLFLFSQPSESRAQSRAGSEAKNFQNPVLWEDLADIDIIRVGDAFYYSASNMHYSPGAPLLRSYDLVHWEYVGHSIPVLDFSPAYDLHGGRAYVGGSWASFLGYRKSEKTFYWGGCIGFKKTHIFTAPAAEGPWTRKAILDNCYYDAGLLIDDDDTMYVAYGNTTIHVAQLSSDAKHEVKTQVVFRTPPGIGVLEGSRFYKVNGNYYIFTTRPANAEYVLRSTTGPFGPYEIRPLLVGASSPVPGAGVPHQGGIVQTPKGDWYYMAFTDAFPGGRIPVLAPLKWGADGWPAVGLVENAWQSSYPMPSVETDHRPDTTGARIELFQARTLGPEWEWNHNPDTTSYSLGHGLTLRAATVTDDLYAARNTLTHRIVGPTSTATISIDCSHMGDGDRTGLALFRDSSAWIGVVRDAGKLRVVMRNDITMDEHWNTKSTGTDIASVPTDKQHIWLRAAADIRPGAGHTATFSYSTDGVTFRPLGVPFVLSNSWQFFMGYRFGIFNYATAKLGGSVEVTSFQLTTP
ncbi:glycoside hydrolase family 43 protein [Granulicella rosea]|uniref:glycoside hydrolase family 43 protein n=1 Tax=Granulicella rosea TaxID=474952 RepID=UPI001C3C2102|nr:glycoside hydrolase 43 family protein [Granulicella rosea]